MFILLEVHFHFFRLEYLKIISDHSSLSFHHNVVISTQAVEGQIREL